MESGITREKAADGKPLKASCNGQVAVDPLSLRLEHGRSKQEHVKDATQAAAAVLVILILAALGGRAVPASVRDLARCIQIPWTAIITVCVAAAITWPLMMLAANSSGNEQQGLVRETASRFMGLIVLAMGIQYLLTGLKSFFGPLAT